MSKARLLIVHSDPSALALLTSMLTSMGHEIEEASNDRTAVRLMERGGVDLMVVGVDPSDLDALELLAYMKRKHRQMPVIVLFSESSPERTKEALRMGALVVLKYPVPATELRAAVTQALGPAAEPVAIAVPVVPNAESQGAGHHARVNGKPHLPPVPMSRPREEARGREWGILGNDPSLRQAVALAASIAPMRAPVLIVGEPGTGKSLMARTLHNMSARPDQPLVAFDCRARGEDGSEPDSQGADFPFHDIAAPSFPETLSRAHGGTLFLNEVGALSDELQSRLLDALLDRDAESPGSGRATPSDVRFLMSSSEDLPGLVERGGFRQELYHRISVICLRLPPLRHRGNDIEILAESLRARFAIECGKNVVGFTRDALDVLHKHDWPGNVRELEAIIRRGVMLSQGSRITSGHLSFGLERPKTPRTAPPTPQAYSSRSIRPLKEALEEPEKRIIIQALQALNWNRQETARMLDINRTTLYKKMKKYGLLVDEPIWVN